MRILAIARELWLHEQRTPAVGATSCPQRQRCRNLVCTDTHRRGLKPCTVGDGLRRFGTSGIRDSTEYMDPAPHGTPHCTLHGHSTCRIHTNMGYPRGAHCTGPVHGGQATCRIHTNMGYSRGAHCTGPVHGHHATSRIHTNTGSCRHGCVQSLATAPVVKNICN